MNFRMCSAISAGRFRKTSAFAIFAGAPEIILLMERKVRYPSSLPGFEETVLDERAVLAFEEEEEAGWNRINEWMWDRACFSAKETRNGLVGQTTHQVVALAYQRLLVRGANLWEIQRYEGNGWPTTAPIGSFSSFSAEFFVCGEVQESTFYRGQDQGEETYDRKVIR